MSLDRQALTEAARDVLERAAFLFCDELPADTQPRATEVVEARIRFRAQVPGELCFRVPRQVAVEAASNLLGVDGGDPEADQSAQAATGELLNMVCGAALVGWFGRSGLWHLGLPATTAYQGTLPSGRPGAVVFLVGTSPIELEVTEVP